MPRGYAGRLRDEVGPVLHASLGRGDPRVDAFASLVGYVVRCGDGLLGNNELDLAEDTYRRSLIGRSYPSFWLEAPLVGDPGFDLHVYYDRGQVRPGERFEDGAGFGMQALFDWYFGRETGGIGVGFAHDLREGSMTTGAYVNFNRCRLDDARGFFGAIGVPEGHDHSEALLERLPESWNPWYMGLFPGRAGTGVRLGSFVGRERQAVYAHDVRELVADLEHVGFCPLDGAMRSCLQQLTELPYRIEVQLDATADGVGPTIGVDLTLDMRSPAQVVEAFGDGGSATHACELLESWGVADDRWRKVAYTSLARVARARSLDGSREELLMLCLPKFIKAKWTDETPQPAKVYLACAARPIKPPTAPWAAGLRSSTST